MKPIIFLLLILISTTTFAQISFNRHNLTNEADGATNVQAIDIDGDGDLDVVYAAQWESKVYWMENVDGLGNFGKKKTIASNTSTGSALYAVDLDGDNDIDILTKGSNFINIAWYENRDGQGDFGEEKNINVSLTGGLADIYASDLDNDGDQDLITASLFEIAWIENDGLGNFGFKQTINTNISHGESVYAADLDGDGDMDVISASSSDSKVAWYENRDGQGNFSSQNVLANDEADAESVYAADIDGDGDMDVLSASSLFDYIKWFENTNGQGNFTERIISSNVKGASAIRAADIDQDGDLDIIAAASKSDQIRWYENTDGQGYFGDFHIISTETYNPQFLDLKDLDGDGDKDILVASKDDDTIVWFETSNALSSNSISLSNISIFPNPVENQVQIHGLNSPLHDLQLYNILGQDVRQFVKIIHQDSNGSQLDFSQLQTGYYLLQSPAIGSHKIWKK